jgi:hypothetical protein
MKCVRMAKYFAEIRSLARSRNRTAVHVLVGIMRSKDAIAAARVSAADVILDCGWGKATQLLESDDADVRAIVVETLAEQRRIHQDDIDAAVQKTVASTLISFGLDNEDRGELRADFQHLRRWRRTVEQAQSYTFKAVITVLATGFIGAVWLGIKAVLAR